MKLVPIQAANEEGIIVDSILSRNLFDSPGGYSKTFRRGYKYRGLDDGTVYYDENVTRLTMNYRNAFLRLSLYHLNQTRNFAKAIEVLDSLEAKIPHRVIPMDYRLMYDVANFYNYAGAKDKYLKWSDEVVAKLQDIIKSTPQEALNQYNPYSVLLSIYEAREEYEKAIEILGRIAATYSATTPGIDQQVKERITQLQGQMALKNAIKKDTVALRQPRNK